MKKRIIGIDVARSLAIFGMIVVNFRMAFGDQGVGWLSSISHIFDGKAAATFVVLAGVGISLMTNKALQNSDKEKLALAKKRILRRVLFLFILGLSYMVIWPADILHYYGIYMLVALLLIERAPKLILLAAAFLVLLYPFVMMLWNYETGWNFDQFIYLDFWTPHGFVRNLFYNGFHPVIPWAAFMLVGVWFGKQNLRDKIFLKKALTLSLGLFAALQLGSSLSIPLLSNGDPIVAEELSLLIGMSPMPPLPIYMLSGSCIAIAVISACILIADQREDHKIISALYRTGKLALTFYVAHVVIGMGISRSH